MAKRKFLLFEKLLQSANRKFRPAFFKSCPSRGLLKGKVSKMTKFSRLWTRRDSVSSPSSIRIFRGGLTALAVASLALLAACGGGGEAPGFAGDPPTIPTPPPVTPPPVTPPPVTPPPVTPPPSLGAYQVVIGIAAYSPPAIFSGTSCADLTVTVANNLTQFPYYGALDYKMIWHEALPSGRILMSYLSSYEAYKTRFAAVIDPITKEVKDYTGDEGPVPRMVPTETEPIPDEWLDGAVLPSGEYPTVGKFAKTTSFMVYTSWTDGRVVYCRDGSGNRVVYSRPEDGFYYFVGFTRP